MLRHVFLYLKEKHFRGAPIKALREVTGNLVLALLANLSALCFGIDDRHVNISVPQKQIGSGQIHYQVPDISQELSRSS